MATQLERVDGVDAEAFERVRAPMLRFFPELVTELGGDVGRILEDAGCDPRQFDSDAADFTYRQVTRLLARAADLLDCPDLGLRLGARQQGNAMFGLLGKVMANSRTYGDALQYVSTHIHAHSPAARVWLRKASGEGRVFCGHDILIDDISSQIQNIEQILLVGHLSAMEMTGGHARARCVHFRHEAVSPLSTYRRYFGCEIRFGEPADGLSFSRRDLAVPIIGRDSRALEEVTASISRLPVLRRLPFHAQVRAVILRRMASDECANEHVAAELNMHPRTLHRRLDAEHTSFQKVKDDVRRELLLYYLERTRLDLAQISERLGFAEQSILARTCRRWYGASPSALREALASKARRAEPTLA